ncbi:MAG: DNA polymerase III subunit beta [Verrucomicrobiota bacterium JB024]|nr:DNA polymerase III subunit beta [Verrucomicrobiota bacterium JB024]
MKFNIERETLADALAAISGPVKARTTFPILAGVLIRAEGGTLYMQTTNLDLEMTTAVTADVERTGTGVLSHSELLQFAKLSDADTVTVDATESSAVVTSGKSKFRLPVLPAKDFPEAKKGGTAEAELSFEAGKLSTAIHALKWAMEQGDKRPAMDGVNIGIVEGQVTLAALNGRVLSFAPMGEAACRKLSVTLPSATVNELARIDAKGTDLVRMKVFDTRVVIEFANGDTMTTKVNASTFPNWRMVVPKSEGEQTAKVGRARLIAAVHRAKLGMSDTGNRVQLNFGQGSIEVAASSDTRAASDSLEAEHAIEPGKSIGMSYLYLLDALGAVKDDDVRLVYRDELSPLLIETSVGTEIIMPLRLK